MVIDLAKFGNPWKDYALSMRNAAMCIADIHHTAQMMMLSEQKPESLVK